MTNEQRPKREPNETMEQYLKRISPAPSEEEEEQADLQAAGDMLDALDFYFSLRRNQGTTFAELSQARDITIQAIVRLKSEL